MATTWEIASVLGSGVAVGSVALDAGGSGYTSAPTVTPTGGAGSGASITAVLAARAIASLSLGSGGSLYTSAPAVSFSGGGGSGATATAVLSSTGGVVSVAILSGGSGWVTGNIVFFISPSGSTNATGTVVASGGAVTSITITNPGSGYASVSGYGWATGSPTSGFFMTATIGFSVASLTLTAGGSGYTSAPSVVFTGGAGSGASATATLAAAAVASLTLSSGGSGYTSPPTLVFSGGGGTGAAATATLSGGYGFQSFASLGLRGLTRELVNQAPDRVTFIQDGAAFDDSALFSFGATLIIKRNGVQWFVGRLVRTSRIGSPQDEAVSYELAGPWWYLDNLVFQHNWKIPTTPTSPSSSLTDEKRSSLILNLKEDGTTLTTLQQITEVITYVNSTASGTVITLGSGFPALNISWEEAKDLTCAEVIRRQLRWAPDACTWFDYSTTPPTLRCARRATASAASLAVDGTDVRVSSVKLDALPELQLPVVVLNFEKVDQQDQISWSSVTQQKYPAGAAVTQFGALVATIQLGGSVSSYQRQKIKTRAIAESSLAWWKKHLPWLDDATISSASISSGAKVLADGGGSVGALTNEIIEGALPSWKESAGARVSVTALLSYTITNADGAITKVVKKPISAIVQGTSLSSPTESSYATYSQFIPIVTGETVPTGLAQSIYDAMSVLQYTGSVRLTAEECLVDITPGQVLNLTGGLSAWSTMNAQIQRVEEKVDTGSTVITVGPAQHLGPQDLIELLRPNRSRSAATSMATRTTGIAKSTGNVDGAPQNANEQASSASAPLSKAVIVDTADTTKKITLDPSALATGQNLTLQTVKVWDDATNTCKTMKVLGTTPV
jgi:hypothetical protein